MIFPKGQIVHENLNTVYTDFDAMLAELTANQFTGYLKVVGWEYEGILLLDAGEVANAVDEVKGERRSGRAAAEAISGQAHQKDTTISVYRLSKELAELSAGLFSGEAVYRDLESDFTSLDRLLVKLQTEKHTGYIEVREKKGSDAALVFLREGQVVESIWMKNGSLLAGPEVLTQITSALVTRGALLDVYRTNPDQRRGASLSDSFSRQEVISFWQVVLNQMEAVVDRAVGQGSFALALKQTGINLADRYSFLDPFAEQFGYSNGQVQITDGTSLAELNQGLCACLTQALSDLVSRSSAVDWSADVWAVVMQLRSKYGRLLGQVGLASELAGIVGAS